MRIGHRPGQGTATLVQAVNDLPSAQASLRDEFAGAARSNGHRSPSKRRPVIDTFAPEGRLIVGRSFTACATTVIAIARSSPRFVHRRPVAAIVRAWRAAGKRLSSRRDCLPPHAVPMWRPRDWRRRHGHGTPRRMRAGGGGTSHRRVAPCPYDRVLQSQHMTFSNNLHGRLAPPSRRCHRR